MISKRLFSGIRIAIKACLPGILMLAAQACGCSRAPKARPPYQEDMSKRDINAVLRDHDRELLAIPGVVGVYVGVLEDGRTPCLKVMVRKKTAELEKRIPKLIEGHPVVLNETGPIRPLGPN